MQNAKVFSVVNKFSESKPKTIVELMDLLCAAIREELYQLDNKCIPFNTSNADILEFILFESLKSVCQFDFSKTFFDIEQYAQQNILFRCQNNKQDTDVKFFLEKTVPWGYYITKHFFTVYKKLNKVDGIVCKWQKGKSLQINIKDERFLQLSFDYLHRSPFYEWSVRNAFSHLLPKKELDKQPLWLLTGFYKAYSAYRQHGNRKITVNVFKREAVPFSSHHVKHDNVWFSALGMKFPTVEGAKNFFRHFNMRIVKKRDVDFFSRSKIISPKYAGEENWDNQNVYLCANFDDIKKRVEIDFDEEDKVNKFCKRLGLKKGMYQIVSNNKYGPKLRINYSAFFSNGLNSQVNYSEKDIAKGYADYVKHKALLITGFMELRKITKAYPSAIFPFLIMTYCDKDPFVPNDVQHEIVSQLQL